MDHRIPPVAPVYGPAPSIAPAGPGPGAKTTSSADKPSGKQARQVEPTQDRAKAESPPLLSSSVRIEIDREAARMVQTFVDPNTGRELNQFPYDNQLAYSRAVVAFERAKNGSR